MSKTTINMPVIKDVSDISFDTIKKLYDNAGIHMPADVERECNTEHPAYVHDDSVITHAIVNANMAWHTAHSVVEQCPDVIIEEYVLSEYISINVEYVKQ